MIHSGRLHGFAQLARELVRWARAEPADAAHEATTALSLVSRLYAAALTLELVEVDGESAEPTRIDHAGWQAAYRRFGALPIGYYSVVFHPLLVPAEEPMTGDLADDLADIYRDLLDGLELYDRGFLSDAQWQWAFGFRAHWGKHAVSALAALHEWATTSGALRVS